MKYLIFVWLISMALGLFSCSSSNLKRENENLRQEIKYLKSQLEQKDYIGRKVAMSTFVYPNKLECEIGDTILLNIGLSCYNTDYNQRLVLEKSPNYRILDASDTITNANNLGRTLIRVIPIVSGNIEINGKMLLDMSHEKKDFAFQQQIQVSK